MTGLTRRSVIAGAGASGLVLPSLGPARAQTSAQPLIIATNLEPDTLDATASHNVLGVRATLCNVAETLMGTSTDGRLVPTLASWAVSPDGKTIEFRLRSGIKFHTGDALTAEDVAFSDGRLAQYSVNYRTFRSRSFDRVEIVDDRTIRFVLKQVDPAFLFLRLISVVSKKYFDKAGEKEFFNHPIGTGPYKFSAYRQGEYLDLEAFPDYWGDKPAIPRARFVFIGDDETRLAKLRSGEADLIMNAPYTSIKALKDHGFRVEELAIPPTPSLRFYFANKKAPWADLRVRQAMAHAIDTKAIVDGLLQGMPRRYPALAPADLGYDPGIDFYAYDPALAKKLLGEAGYPNGFKMRLHYWTGFVTGIPETAEAVILYLKAVDIEASGAASDVGTMIQTLGKVRRDESIEFISISPVQLADNFDPVASLIAGYQSDSMTSGYMNPEFDKAIAAASATLDEQQRAGLIGQAVRILHDDVAMIPLWTQVSTYAMKPNIDFKPTERIGLPLMQVKDVTYR